MDSRTVKVAEANRDIDLLRSDTPKLPKRWGEDSRPANRSFTRVEQPSPTTGLLKVGRVDRS